jgi:tetratricopeptide (TPR) repeat protein
LGGVKLQRELTEQEIQRHNVLYEQANALLKGEVLIDGQPLANRPGFFARRKLRKAMRLFEEVPKLNPENWAAVFFMAKAHHRLGETKEALELMLRAHRGDPTVSGFAREAGLVAGQLGRFQESIELAKRAIETRPTDGSLYSNLGLSCLLAGEPAQAVQAFERAVELERGHHLTPRLLWVARQVLAGALPAPRSEAEVARAAQKQRGSITRGHSLAATRWAA